MEASRHPRQSHQSHQRAPRDVSFLGTFIQRPREGVCGFPIKCLGGRPSKCTEQTTLSRSLLLGASASILAALGSRPRDCSRCLGRCQREDPRAGLTAGKDPREGGIKTRLRPPGRVSTSGSFRERAKADPAFQALEQTAAPALTETSHAGQED